MKNLGAKLKAAREAMQLSLRDVADATRLRIPVLEKMEDGSFDYKLQDIYKRGFLRIYAAFLKLDVADIMREYNTALAMRSASEDGRRRVIAVQSEDESEPIQETNFGDSVQEQESDVDMTAKYVKLGGAFVLAILAIIVVVMIVSSLTKSASDSDELVPEQTQQVVEKNVSPINEVAVEPAVLEISAYADTYITVAQAANHAKAVFTGALKAGEKKDFKLDEALFVRVTDASKVKMSRNGKVIYDKTLSGVRGFDVSPR